MSKAKTPIYHAIKAWHNGIEYDSKLEARGVRLICKLGGDYEREPQGFDVDGEIYHPDGLVWRIANFAEVFGEGMPALCVEFKGAFNNYGRKDEQKTLKFAQTMPFIVIDRLENFDFLLNNIESISRKPARGAKEIRPFYSYQIHSWVLPAMNKKGEMVLLTANNINEIEFDRDHTAKVYEEVENYREWLDDEYKQWREEREERLRVEKEILEECETIFDNLNFKHINLFKICLLCSDKEKEINFWRNFEYKRNFPIKARKELLRRLEKYVIVRRINYLKRELSIKHNEAISLNSKNKHLNFEQFMKFVEKKFWEKMAQKENVPLRVEDSIEALGDFMFSVKHQGYLVGWFIQKGIEYRVIKTDKQNIVISNDYFTRNYNKIFDELHKTGYYYATN